MKTKTIYLIKYNDCYGNGDDDSIEVAVSKRSDFKKWLKKHNAERKADGNEPENEDEFDLIEVELIVTF